MSFNDPLHHEAWNSCESRYHDYSKPATAQSQDKVEKRSVVVTMELFKEKAHQVGTAALTVGTIKSAVHAGNLRSLIVGSLVIVVCGCASVLPCEWILQSDRHGMTMIRSPIFQILPLLI